MPGSGGLRMREVRVPLADPAAATCSCADYVIRRRTCKHIAAALTAASRLDPTWPVAVDTRVASGPRSPGSFRLHEALRGLQAAESESSA